MALTKAGIQHLIAFTVFAVLAIFTLSHHEVWRDEMQAFSLVRSSTSLAELMTNKAYEGHPVLWYLILYITTRFSASVVSMQVVHLLIALGGAALFLRYFPGKPVVKCLLVFGYFFIYEYTVISRNYAIEYTLLFGLLTTVQNRRWWLSALLLCLLMQTNVFGFLLGAALMPVLLYLLWPQQKKQAGFTVLIFSAAALFFWFTVRPPADTGFSPGWTFTWSDLQKAIASFWDVFVPIPQAQLNSWNSNFISKDHTLLKMILALGLFTATLFTLRKSKIALAFFVCACLLTLLFLTTKYLGFVRHQGHYFLAFVVALWLAKLPDAESEESDHSEVNLFTYTLLSIQVLGGLIACYMDWQFPFSNAQRVSDYINKNYPGAQLSAYPDYIGTAVGVFTNRNIYYPCSNRYGTFIIWDTKRLDLDEGTIIGLVGRKKAAGQQMLLLSESVLQQTDSLNAYGLQLIDSFPPTIVKNEQYFIYK